MNFIKMFYMNKGKECLAKTQFTMFMLTCLSDVIYTRFDGGAVDFSGWAVLLGASAALYFGRSHTKETKNV